MSVKDPTDYETFRALAEATRLRIVMLLLEGELCVCDLMEVLNLPQSTVSRHMARLKGADLVTDRREGKWVHYTLRETALLAALRQYLEGCRRADPYVTDLARLTVYLDTKEGG